MAQSAVAGSAGPAVWPLWIAVLLLAGACVFLYLREPPDPRPQIEAQAAVAVGALERRIAALEARPATPAAAPDLGPLTERLAAAERRVAELAARPVAAGAPAPAPTEAINAAIAPLAARLAAIEQRPAPAAPAPPPPAASPEQVAQLTQRLAALEARPAAADPGARLTALEARLASVRAATAVAVRLAAGEPLAPALGLLPAGVEPPPALRAFASAAPPTELVLRREFAAAARAAKDASTAEGSDAVSAVRGFLAGLVTVRRGEEVVVGTNDAAALAAAEVRLMAGDLAGAIAALAPLSAGAAQAMAPWKARAQALLDARAALGALAS